MQPTFLRNPLFDVFGDSISIVDRAGRLRACNGRDGPGFGYTTEQIDGRSLLGIIADEDRPRIERAFDDLAARPDAHWVDEVRIVGADGRSHLVELAAVNCYEEEEIGGIVLVAREITDRRLSLHLLECQAQVIDGIIAGRPLEETLEGVLDLLAGIFEGAGLAVAVTDAATISTLRTRQVGDDVRRAVEALVVHELPAAREVVRPGPSHIVDIAAARSDGSRADDAPDGLEVLAAAGIEAFWLEPVRSDAHADVIGAIGIFCRQRATPDAHELSAVHAAARLIALALDRSRAEVQLELAATRDPLTGLDNRVSFEAAITAALQRHRRVVTVLMVDLDHFRLVNDAHGHQVGDWVLLEAARRLVDVAGTGARVARWGGDRFAILASPIDAAEDAVGLAERVRRTLAEPFVIGEHEVYLSAAVGIAWSDAGPFESAGALLANVDAALDEAKHQRGSGGIAVFHQGLQDRAVDRLDHERGLRQAMVRGELRVHLQPEIDLTTGRIVGAEALVRWEHPTRGLVLPGEFVPLAEESGLITAIGEWVLRAALDQARRLRDRFSLPSFAVSVNVSHAQLASAFVTQVAEALEAFDWPAGDLVLELTESGLMAEGDRSAAMLSQLKELGVRLAIDDFGTGYSSLSYLHTLPVDIVKIDRSFVAGGDDVERTRSVARAIVQIADTLGLTSVAEGIETTEHLAMVRGLGCRLGQGYLFSRPVDHDAFAQLLERGPRW